MRGKSMILIVIALGCGLVASIGISKILDRNGDKPAASETKKIYVTVRDVDISEIFDAEMIKLEEWPADKVPEGAASKLEEVVGLVPNQRLFAGEVIRKEKLADKDSFGQAAIRIPHGYRVQAINVKSASTAGGIVTPGDHVDVQVYLRKSASIPQPTTKTILEDVRVFAVNAETNKQLDEEGQKINAKTVSLLVQPDQLHTLLLASQLGQINLSLRNPGDETQTLGDNGAGIDELLGTVAPEDGTPPKDATSTVANTDAADRNGPDFADFLAGVMAEPEAEQTTQSDQLATSEFKMQMLTPKASPRLA